MNTSTLRLDPNKVCGGDVGGTHVRFRISTSTGEVVCDRYYESKEFDSLDAVIDQLLVDLGFCPGRFLLAMAGPRDKKTGAIDMTNLDWSPFNPGETAARLALVVEIKDEGNPDAAVVVVDTSNDMDAAVEGTDDVTIDDLDPICGPWDEDGVELGDVTVVTFSTGIGKAHKHRNGTRVASEFGWSAWQPMSWLEWEYLCYLRNCYPDIDGSIGVELAAGGKHGYDNAYDFLTMEKGLQPADKVADRVDELRGEGDGIAEAIFGGAWEGDEVCEKVLNIIGSIQGQFLYNSWCGTLPDTILLIGSGMQKPRNAEYFVKHTPFKRRLIPKGTQHEALVRRCRIAAITDPDEGMKGAVRIALSAG